MIVNFIDPDWLNRKTWWAGWPCIMFIAIIYSAVGEVALSLLESLLLLVIARALANFRTEEGLWMLATVFLVFSLSHFATWVSMGVLDQFRNAKVSYMVVADYAVALLIVLLQALLSLFVVRSNYPLRRVNKVKLTKLPGTESAE